MNLLDIIYKNLEGKDYDDLTKIRWIYLFICKLYAYDTRYLFSFGKIKENIYNTTVDVTNAKDFEVVCYTQARILIDILTEFGYQAEIKQVTSDPLTHVYVIVKYKDGILKLDPTTRHDTARVKINNDTRDFNSLTEDYLFSDKLMMIDRRLSPAFNDLYFTTNSVSNIAGYKLEEIYRYAEAYNIPEREIFFKKLETVYEMINAKTDLKYYDDVDFYYSYLLKIFNINCKKTKINGKTQYSNCYYVKPVVLFNINDSSMHDIINISCVQYENTPIRFYLLKNNGESFKIKEIFKDEALDILEQYEYPLCQYMLLENAKNLDTEPTVNNKI